MTAETSKEEAPLFGAAAGSTPIPAVVPNAPSGTGAPKGASSTSPPSPKSIGPISPPGPPATSVAGPGTGGIAVGDNASETIDDDDDGPSDGVDEMVGALAVESACTDPTKAMKIRAKHTI